MSDTRCGSLAGYHVHRRAAEQPCAPCQRAQTEYMRAWRHRTGRSGAAFVSVADIRQYVTGERA